MQEKKNLIIVLCILIIVILLILVGILFYQTTQKEENTNNENSNITEENTILNNTNTSDTNEVLLDVSIDEKYETRTQEGLPTTIKTLKYVSSAGYSMRYCPDEFTISKDEGMDIYTAKNSNNYLTVEGYSTPYETSISNLGLSNSSKTTVNGYEATYYSKVVNDRKQTYYYIKVDNGVFIITYYHPNTSEFVEGVGEIFQDMINTFEINK